MAYTKEDEINEFKKILHREPSFLILKSKIFYDGKQFSTKIPMKVVKILKLEPEKDIFIYSIKIPASIAERPEIQLKIGEEDDKSD